MSFIEFLLWKYNQSLPTLFVNTPGKDLHLLEQLNTLLAKARKLAQEREEHEKLIKELEEKATSGGYQGAKANIELQMLRAKRWTIINKETLTTAASAKVLKKVNQDISAEHNTHNQSAWDMEQARMRALKEDEARAREEGKKRLEEKIKNMGLEPHPASFSPSKVLALSRQPASFSPSKLAL
eukprot:8033579-Pyramimonas_sp.AAC.1